jgi:hypothetical protein
VTAVRRIPDRRRCWRGLYHPERGCPQVQLQTSRTKIKIFIDERYEYEQPRLLENKEGMVASQMPSLTTWGFRNKTWGFRNKPKIMIFIKAVGPRHSPGEVVCSAIHMH